MSFAQFEREVTSERIRDQIAASKRKGLWVGGMVPLGYILKEGQLQIHEDEAKTSARHDAAALTSEASDHPYHR